MSKKATRANYPAEGLALLARLIAQRCIKRKVEHESAEGKPTSENGKSPTGSNKRRGARRRMFPPGDK